MNLGLKGKNVFVTASTNGIGKEIARNFLEEGANVIINGRDCQRLQEVTISFSKKYGTHRVQGVIGDMTNENSILNARDTILNYLGKLDILIANLGTGKPIGSDKLEMAEWYHMYEYNLFSAIRLISSFENTLKKAEEANIVLLSSLAGHEKISAPIAYASAKNGIRVLVKYLADDYARYGIRVNGVSPGNILYPGGRWEELLTGNREKIEEYINVSVPMKRFGKPEEIANVVVFLASKKASFITGEVLKVDGGQSRAI